MFACKDWKNLADQIINSGAEINFSSGVDIRVMNDEKIKALMQMKINHVHFAFDRYADKDIITRKLEQFANMTHYNRRFVTVYILTNFDTTIDQDIERVEFVKSLGFNPYVMRYNRQSIKRGSLINKLARYANNKKICWTVKTFADYLRKMEAD